MHLWVELRFPPRTCQVKLDKISQEFVDGVCNVIAMDVLHLCKNNVGTPPLPAANEKCVASKQATANEGQGKSSQIPKTGRDNGDETTQKKTLLGNLAVEWEHRVATSLNSPIWEPANTPAHHPGDNSKETLGYIEHCGKKKEKIMRTLCSMHRSSTTGKVRNI